MAVKRFIGKVFYPVIYEGEAADAAGALEQAAVTNNKQKEVPVFTPSSQRCEEMRWGVSQLLCAEESGLRIGRVFEAARREVFFWPKNNKGLFFCPRAGARVPIALTGLRILVFETKIAFFEMDFELQNLPLADAMNATYYLCEPKDEANHFETVVGASFVVPHCAIVALHLFGPDVGLGPACVEVIFDCCTALRNAAGGSAFSRHLDDTVGSTRTIDSCCRCIFQD